jgi:hypothetical protein
MDTIGSVRCSEVNNTMPLLRTVRLGVIPASLKVAPQKKAKHANSRKKNQLIAL